MATALGHAYLPIIPSISGLQAQIQKQLGKPLEDASKRAGETIERNIASAADRATKSLEKTKKVQEELAKQAEEQEKRVQIAKTKTEDATKKIRAAEIDLERTRNQSTAKVEQAEKNLQKLRDNSSSTAEQLAKAELAVNDARLASESAIIKKENAVSRAKSSSIKAASDLEKAERDLAEAQDKAADASDEVVASQKRLEKAQEGTKKGILGSLGASTDLRKELNHLGKELDQTSNKSEGFGNKLLSGFKTIGKGALLGVGAKAGNAVIEGVQGAFSSGMDRLQSMETATTTLKGLKFEAQEIEKIQDNALEAVKGTAFGLGESAQIAAQLVAANVQPGEDLVKTLKLVGDSATTAGVGMGEMGAIWAKVAANGKADMGEINQLSDRGIGIRQKLAEELGVSMEDLQGKVREGAITFDVWSKAMDSALGGAADVAGNTVKGSFDNMNAALGRVGAQLGGPIFERLPGLFQNIGESFDTFGKKIEPVVDQISSDLGPIMDDLIEKMGVALGAAMAALGDAIVGTYNKVKELIEYYKANKVVIDGIAVVLGTMTATFLTLKGAVAAYRQVQLLATAAMGAFNLVLNANPIMLAVTAIAGLTAALAYFFTKTETGQKIWEQFTNFLKSSFEVAAQVIGEAVGHVVAFFETAVEKANTFGTAFVSFWQNNIQPVITGFIDAAKTVAQVILTVVITPFYLLGQAVEAAFKLIASMFQWLYDNYFKKYVDFMILGFQAWQIVISQVVEIVKTKLTEFGLKMQELWTNYVSPVLDWINQKWNVTKEIISLAIEYIKLKIQEFANKVQELWASYVQPILDYIANKWRFLQGVMVGVFNYVKSNVFDKFHSVLRGLQNGFRATVDNIRDSWNEIKRHTAKPINFVIETVYNNGIKKVWDKVGEFIGSEKKLPNIQKIGGYATGGVLPGYTPGRDVHRFYSPTAGYLDLSGGESVMRPEWTRAVGGPAAVERLNKAARTGGINGVKWAMGDNQFANGGVIGVGQPIPKGMPLVQLAKGGDPQIEASIRRVDRFLQGEHGKPYQYGGEGNPSWDCSGLWSGIVQELNVPGSARNGRIFNTESDFSQFGFQPGLNGRVTIGVHRGGGGPQSHMAGTIDGKNAESGGNGVQWGGLAIGSGDSSFELKYTLTKFLGKYLPGGNGGGGFGSFISGLVSDAFSSILDPIEERIPKLPGLWGEVPPGMFHLIVDGFKEAITGMVGFTGGDSGGGVNGNVESWRSMAMEAMRRNGFSTDPAQVEAMLKQIQTESGGNAQAVQQVDDINSGWNDAQGLLQVTPGTFAMYRDPELPNDLHDPWANMNAALRYYKSTYGNDLTTTWGHGHGYATGGVLPGYTPGKDVHRFFSPTAGFLDLSGGEAILRPEVTRALGGAPVINAMNAAAKSGSSALHRQFGSMKFANGGVIPGGVPFSISSSNDFAKATATLQAAAEEIQVAFQGGDFGYGAVQSVVQDEQLAKQIVNASAALGAAAEEINAAFNLQDFGYGAVLNIVKDEQLAKGIVDSTYALGKFLLSGKEGKEAIEKFNAALDAQEEKTQAVVEAQKKLQEIEDKESDEYKQAQEALTAARKEESDAIKAVRDAEKALHTARANAVKELTDTFLKGFQECSDAINDFWQGISKLNASVDESRQLVAKNELQLAVDRINQLSALQGLRIAEFDLMKARKQGQLAVFQAEQELSIARQENLLLGSTGVEALAGALNRFRETGVFSIDAVTETLMERTALVRAAEYNVAMVRAQSLIDQEKAAQAVRDASLAAAKASLQHAYTAQLLEISTAKLNEQAKQLYGMSQHAATGAQRGLEGKQQRNKGIAGLLGAVVGGVASFMTGNVAGGIASVTGGIKSIADIVQGEKQRKAYDKELKELENSLDKKTKAGLIAGDVFGGLAAIGGGALAFLPENQYGLDTAIGGMQIGSAIVDTTYRSTLKDLELKMERIEYDAKGREDALTRDFQAKTAEIDMKSAINQMEHTQRLTELEGVKELAEISKQIAESNIKGEVEVLGSLAQIAQERRDSMLQIQQTAAGDIKEALEVAKRQAVTAGENSSRVGNKKLQPIYMDSRKTSYSAEEVKDLFDTINQSQSDLELRIEEIEAERRTSATGYVVARR